jgi:hypothetical protein
VVDARIPERWLNDRRITRLSDPGWRLHTFALLWSVANRTEGWLDEDDLADIPRVDPKRMAELEAAGLWEQHGGQWAFVDFDSTQTTNAELDAAEAARKAAREKKARQRAAAAAAAMAESKSGAKPESKDPVSRGTSRGTRKGTSQASARPVPEPGALTATNGKSESRSNLSTDVGSRTSHLDEKPLGQEPWPAMEQPAPGLPPRFPGIDRVRAESEAVRDG